MRIIDFGLSTQFNSQSEDKSEVEKLTSLVGTPNYIAPEVLRYSYDEKCDIWSLGVIAYQLFSQGEFPFDGDSEIQIYSKIRKGKFYLPEKLSESHKREHQR